MYVNQCDQITRKNYGEIERSHIFGWWLCNRYLLLFCLALESLESKKSWQTHSKILYTAFQIHSWHITISDIRKYTIVVDFDWIVNHEKCLMNSIQTWQRLRNKSKNIHSVTHTRKYYYRFSFPTSTTWCLNGQCIKFKCQT